MIAMKRGCLDAAELNHVLKGDVSAESFDSAISHLDECQRCREAAENILPGGSWFGEDVPVVSDPLQSETACQAAVHRLLQKDELSMSGLHSGGLSQSQSDLPQTQLGPYQLLQPLGSGGMACVFLAEHRRLKRRCAVKILPRERVDQPGWLERFDREMTSVASLEHPHVVRATDAGHQDGWHYLVMEYLEGMDVGAIATRVGTLDVADACEIVRQAAMGLSHVHQHGLVHRDIKPSNLMLGRDGQVKLLDLGLVLAGDDPLSVDDRLTTVGHLMGTLPYMAPEQLLDSRDAEASADLYSLGATFFRLLTGRLPHPPRGGLAKQVMTITSEDAPPISSLRDDCPPAVTDLVDQMLHRDPAQRPASAHEVAERLEQPAAAARLKKLLREAARIPASETPSPSQLWSSHPQATPQKSPPRRWPRVVAAFSPLLLLFGWIIKIETDCGELVINHNGSDATIEVSRGDEVVERLSVVAGNDNTFNLRKGSYTIAISGSDELILSEKKVTIGRGEQARVDILPKGADRLYQGKTFEKWRELLVRESDVRMIAEAMSALEILSRETALRDEAAKATLKTARMWGGFIASAPTAATYESEPSQAYMHHLVEIYPRYDDDGIKPLLEELENGNPRSHAATIWLLDKMAELEPLKDANLAELLKSASDSLENISLPAASQARDRAKNLAVRWLATHGKKIISHAWLVDYISEEIRHHHTRAASHFQDPSTPPYVDLAMLEAAIQLQDAGLLELDWEWAARNLLMAHDTVLRNRVSETVFSALKQKAPDALLQALHNRIASIRLTHSAYGNETAGLYAEEYGKTVPYSSPVFGLTLPKSLWPTMLEFYSENLPEAQIPVGLEQLKNLRNDMFSLADHPKNPLRFIDAAIETLEGRSQQE